MGFWNAASGLQTEQLIFLILALSVAFLFEFINGFHDTANAVTTVIYTHTLSAVPAVIYSGLMNLLGALITVLFFSASVAFSIVNLLPVDLLIDANSNAALVMVLPLLISGVIWNLSTWYVGLPVSSSHTLIGAILGVGMANSLWEYHNVTGVNWGKAGEVCLGLLLSPLIGFLAAGGVLLLMKRVMKEPRLYAPPQEGDRPPRWVRGVLFLTCGAVSFAHGSNDGQKGMGLVLLVLIGFMPIHYALNVDKPEHAPQLLAALDEVRNDYKQCKVPLPDKLDENLKYLTAKLQGQSSLVALANSEDKSPSGKPINVRWQVREALFQVDLELKKVVLGPGPLPPETVKHLDQIRRERINPQIEYVPLWVVVSTALALGLGTCVGYKRIVVTVAEKIGKTHLTYGQGAAAEAVAAATILLADVADLPVSTTHVLSSGVAGTMAANGSGIQRGTCRRIAMAWILTMPACIVLAAILFWVGRLIVR